jgi:hypothetical protein
VRGGQKGHAHAVKLEIKDFGLATAAEGYDGAPGRQVECRPHVFEWRFLLIVEQAAGRARQSQPRAARSSSRSRLARAAPLEGSKSLWIGANNMRLVVMSEHRETPRKSKQVGRRYTFLYLC